ncbi:MAG: hypothetical protein IKU52_02560 [Clostridia bacterium]|nr:hypothetical protein [Clostridia bacterium]
MKTLRILLTVLLAFALCFTLISCSKKSNKEANETTQEHTTEAKKDSETDKKETKKEKETKEKEEKEEETETEKEEETQKEEETDSIPSYDVSLFSGTWMNENGGYLMVDDDGNWMYTDGSETTVNGSFFIAENGNILAHYNSKTSAVYVGNESDITINGLGSFIRV